MGTRWRMALAVGGIFLLVVVVWVLRDGDGQKGEADLDVEVVEPSVTLEEEERVLTYAFLGIGSWSPPTGVIEEFSEQYGINVRQDPLVGYDKLVTRLAAGEEFLPDLIFVHEKDAIDLVRSNALVELDSLCQEAGIDPATLPPGNELYPAVYEGKRFFLRVEGSAMNRPVLVGLVRRRFVSEAFELAYWIARSGSSWRPADYDGVIWNMDFQLLVNDYFLPYSFELLYHNVLHPDLQEYWTEEEFVKRHKEYLEYEWRYVARVMPEEVQKVGTYVSPYTEKEYDQVVRVEVTLWNEVRENHSRGSAFAPGSSSVVQDLVQTYLYFTPVDGRWCLLL